MNLRNLNHLIYKIVYAISNSTNLSRGKIHFQMYR